MEQLGRFVVREELGAGTHSVVYAAREDDRQCALRVFNEEALAEGEPHREQFRDALEGLKRVAHPSIVKVYEAGEEEGRLYVAMELMECPTLEQKLAEEGALQEEQIVLFVRQAAQALDKARDMGYFHGALNADNVFVVSNEKIKLSDFAVKALLEQPDTLGQFSTPSQEDAGEVEEEEWVTAEDLLRARSEGGDEQMLEEDLTSLGVLTMRMLGVDVPERGNADLDDYRTVLMKEAFAGLAAQEEAASRQTQEVIRRLLTPGGFDSPGQVVVELASAMLLRRPFATAGAGPELGEQATAETAAVARAAEPEYEEIEMPSLGDLSDLEFMGDPTAAAFTPFFYWESRRGGRFFVIHDSEQLTIGRDPDYADVALLDPAISRQHCTLAREGSVIRIEDLGSTNGTFVNGERIEAAEVTTGDTVRVGSTRMYLTLTSRG
ncbi:MAG: FHA domain-containing protein [Candidatus Brocadiia bacterium]